MSSLLRAVVLLMVVCDPLGAFAIAGGLCEGAGSATLRRLAAVASGTAFAVLAAAALASDAAAGFLDLSSGERHSRGRRRAGRAGCLAARARRPDGSRSGVERRRDTWSPRADRVPPSWRARGRYW
ncbi:MAG: hypothetical protein M5T61_12240 [Acidimicrobiia bacterium]|nr:hypothetical protein [Acidimicrobiia bacterium]